MVFWFSNLFYIIQVHDPTIRITMTEDTKRNKKSGTYPDIKI